MQIERRRWGVGVERESERERDAERVRKQRVCE
jgi:hypothetical protein